jgi:Kazal-type serine protease inhibitor domain
MSGGLAGMGNAAGIPGAGGAGPATCGVDTDCMPGWLCEKQGCDALTGVCVPWPLFCPPAPAPVCGCDGITYWNDCIRLQSPGHAQQQSPDQCRANACTCEVGADCMVPYASCSHLLPTGEVCGHGMGACWVLPPQCEPSADSKMWRECKPPDPGQLPGCLDTCNAIATEHTYGELHRGDTCN